jgi:lipopolysaccharide export system ATP-binding protein
MSDQQSTLSTHHLHKRYKSRTVVHDVSFDVVSGEVVGLLGPNGAGKTTCFYMVVGLVACDGGDVHLDGVKLTHLPIHQRARLGVSYLPQEASVFRKLTVSENIKAVLELQKLSADEIAAARMICSKSCTSVTCAPVPRLPCPEANGGELKLPVRLPADHVSFCSTSLSLGVDPIAVLDIQKIIRFLKERGIGVLITDHNVRETLGICDHAYIINEGSVLAAGRPDEIIYNENVRKVYLGENFRL